MCQGDSFAGWLKRHQLSTAAPASENGRYNGLQGARKEVKTRTLKRQGCGTRGGSVTLGRARIRYCGCAVETFSAGGGSSEGVEKASRGDGFRITMSMRRFLARPSGVVLGATGRNSA